MNDNFSAGDIVGYVFAQPGNDTTFLLLTEVRQEDASAYDITFDFALDSVPLEDIWHASEQELESKIMFSSDTPNRPAGLYSIRDLVKAIRNGRSEHEAKVLVGKARVWTI